MYQNYKVSSLPSKIRVSLCQPAANSQPGKDKIGDMHEKIQFSLLGQFRIKRQTGSNEGDLEN